MTNQPKWTPGPWAIMGPTSQDGFMIYDRGMYGVGEAWNLNGRPENEANAHLIAAAPDLYAALEKCLRWMEDLRASGDAGNWEWHPADEYPAGLAALSKARGQV